MIELKGKYNVAGVFADELEESASKQIIELCNQKFVEGSKIRIMPDVHAGIGCTIGTTMTIDDKVVPNLVGVDIGCGMHTYQFKKTKLNLPKISDFIKENIPSGFNTYDQIIKNFPIERLKCFKHLKNTDRIRKSLGTLGGGNHFIEINISENNEYYLVIHSGSRNLGKQVAEFYQKKAYLTLLNKNIDKNINKNLAYCDGELLDNYLSDMEIAQRFAYENREMIAKKIICEFKFDVMTSFSTIHNYIDLKSMILRKGAVSAKKNERILIPLNMRDGSLLAIGKGNPEWNYSAPHGAGRLMSRKKAKESIEMREFIESMEGIYSDCISIKTLDESPQAYKQLDSIIKYLDETLEIINILKPIFNYKAI